MRISLFIITVLLVISSCASNKTSGYYNKPQAEIHYGIAEDENVVVDISYIGALGRNFIFECSVKNRGGDYIVVDQQDFVMLIGEQEEIRPIEVERSVKELLTERQKIKKQKKTNTILAIVGAGVSVLAGVANGVSVGETIGFASEPLLYAAEDNTWANRGIASVEDEVRYLETSLFRNEHILSGQTSTMDVLFRVKPIDSDVTIVVYIDDHEYAVSFDHSLFDL